MFALSRWLSIAKVVAREVRKILSLIQKSLQSSELVEKHSIAIVHKCQQSLRKVNLLKKNLCRVNARAMG